MKTAKMFITIVFVGMLSAIWAHPMIVDVAEGSNDGVIDLTALGSQIFGVPSKKSGDLVRNWKPGMKQRPYEMGLYYQGDILIPVMGKASALRLESYWWPNAIVPYVLSGNFTSNEIAEIMSAMQVFHDRTCVKFVPRTNEADYVMIKYDETGCWSSLGRIGGMQALNLQRDGCIYGDTIIHELMHALGFIHEQSKPERDDYVTINYNNTDPNMAYNFDKYTFDQVTNFSLPYDYGSIMHYSSGAFSINGLPTIVSKQPNLTFGQALTLSDIDVESVRSLYKCSRYCFGNS